MFSSNCLATAPIDLAMAGMERAITDPFLKRSTAALILVSNALLAFLLFEHGGSVEGLLYDSRLLVANGMSPIVAIKLQRAWSSITQWTLQHPYLRTFYSLMLANGLYGDTVLMQVPWLLSSFFETAAQLVLILASLWILLLHFEPMTVPHILSILTQLLLIQLYSGMWTLVALWTFQSSIEEMIEVIAASRGPTIVLSYDPNTQRMTAREMSPPRLGRRTPSAAPEPDQPQPQPFFRPPASGRFAPAARPEDDADELQSQDDSSEASVSQASSQRTKRKEDKRSSEGITRGPQIEKDSILTDEDEEEATEAKGADGPSAWKESGTPTATDELRSKEVGEGVEHITLGQSERPAGPSVDPTTPTAKATGPEESSEDTKATATGGCRGPNAPCRRGPTEPSNAPAAESQTIPESAGQEIAQTQGSRPGFQGCDAPDAACRGNEPAPPGTGPGFTKIVEEGDTYITKQFTPSRPPETTDNARHQKTPATTAADAARTAPQDESSCDPKDEATVCPGTGQLTRPQGWVCPPESQCWEREVEIRSEEAKAEPEEDKPKAVFKDEVPLEELLIVVDVGADAMTQAQQLVADEAAEAIPIHFTAQTDEAPLVEGEVAEADAQTTTVSLADAPPEEEEVDDLFSQNPTEGEDRLRGGEQALEDNGCLSDATCRVHENQCPMHVAMQDCFKAESVVDVSEARKESSITAKEIILPEGDEKDTFASETIYCHPPDALCGPKELDIPVRTEGGQMDSLPTDTRMAGSPDGFCRQNEQDISLDIRTSDVNVSVYSTEETISDSPTYSAPNISILPSESECPRESMCNLNVCDVKIFEDFSVANAHTKEGDSKVAKELVLTEAAPRTLSCDTYCPCQSEDLQGLKERDLSKDCRLDAGTDVTACSVCHVSEMSVQPGSCENPRSSIYETEGMNPEVERVAVVLNTQINEKICSEDTEQRTLTERVSFANEENWMCSNENMTRMNEIEALKDVCPDVGDTDFAFPDDSAFVPTGLQASCSPISQCPEEWEGLVQSTNSKGGSASLHPDVDEERKR